MIFLSLFLDLLLAFGGTAAFATAEGDPVLQGAHRTHGHLPGPGDDHGNTHEHHGRHGHTVTFGGGGNHQTPPHQF